MDYNAWAAARQLSDILQPDTTTAKAVCEAVRPNFRYKAILWNTAGIADVIDAYAHVEKIVTVAGGVYPLKNCGVRTGGNTTLAQGDFVLLYD